MVGPPPPCCCIFFHDGIVLCYTMVHQPHIPPPHTHTHHRAAAGGEYQVVLSLISAADAESAAAATLPLSAVPRMTLPFGHPPPNHPGLEAVSAAQMTARGLDKGSRNVAKAPLHPPPGIWTRYTCR